jgi:aminopeptidase-like protein
LNTNDIIDREEYANDHVSEAGAAMHALARRLFPICRSLTGEGVRETLSILRESMPDLVVYDVRSGEECLDWTVPPEWNIRGARLVGPDGQKVVDFADHNLHVVGYSTPVDVELDLEDLQQHLHSLADQPDAIPYVTSYYKERWGFCMTHQQRESLQPGRYRATIDSSLAPGRLNYGELVLPGETDEEIFISTYICHPSLANNELSGPAVATQLAKWLSGLTYRRYTYRFVFIPETIGSIVYISRNLKHLKRHVVAGFNLTCLGDDRCFSFMPSRYGNTKSDFVARHVLRHFAKEYKSYSFLQRGSDERQYCSPGVDLPIATVMRSKYGEYPEYHTSLDDLDLVTPSGLGGGYEALRLCLVTLEDDRIYRTKVLGEPQMGPRGLYSSLGGKSADVVARTRLSILAYADGSNSFLEIAEILNQPVWVLRPLLDDLISHDLLEEIKEKEPL